ncbi:stage VI sporulation protein F [Tenuibacillus multivorans]|uniref:stage VI sporulation protein F n=1 Tax=Tenuibacillus multivorans TaxID=237069 RepID=UPI000B87FEE3|nr:stage VI sporulation protein F [Tenuibacillus multivorans]
MFNNFFGNIERKTGVNVNEVVQLAQSLQNANFKDEHTVRNVVKRVSEIAGKPVSKQKEDYIVNAIVSGKVPKDMKEIEKMMGK